MLDIRQLQYFVAVAEEEHVGRAAERLHISQSPLSRQIAQLEEKLGLTLFERSQQRIRLTRDGRTFLAEAQAFLTHARRLESLAKRLGRGDEGGLCIGYIENAMHAGVLPAGLRTCAPRGRRSMWRCTACTRRSSWKACASAAWTSRWSAIRRRRRPRPGIRAGAQRSDDPGPAGWPSSVRGEGTAAGRSGRPGMDRRAPSRNRRTHHDFVAACVRSGFTPAITMEASEPTTALGLVAAGLGVALVQQGLRHQAPPGVVLRELPWFSYRAPLWAGLAPRQPASTGGQLPRDPADDKKGLVISHEAFCILAPRPGLEPGTCGLTVRRSTN
jgi:DNA-binding transcriptional LysR family regulator